MEILFIVDSVKNIDQKISMLDTLGGNIKFFVDAKLAVDVIKNKDILSKMVAIYNNNVNDSIDKYLKSGEYKPTQTLLYHSSAKLTLNMIAQLRECLIINPRTVYFTKKFSWWGKFKLWFYQKFTNMIFGMNDKYASAKVQYFSAEMMSVLAESNFKNHIFEVGGALTIELNKVDEKTFYDKPKFSKQYVYSLIVFCLTLICYVALEKFFKLPFWAYLLTILLLLAIIINIIITAIKIKIDIRFKK